MRPLAIKNTAWLALFIFGLVMYYQPVLNAAVLGGNMLSYQGTLEKISEGPVSYHLHVDDKIFSVDKKDRGLIKKAELLIGKQVSINYQTADSKVVAIKLYKERTFR